MCKHLAPVTKIHLVGERVDALHEEPVSLEDIQDHYTADGFSEVKMCSVAIFYWGLGGVKEV